MGICTSIKEVPQSSRRSSRSEKNEKKSEKLEIFESENRPKTARIKNKKSLNQLELNNDVIITRNEQNLENLYSKKKLLGKGAFGEVWLVKNNELQKDYAMKIIKKTSNSESEEREIMNEISILKTLDHPKILKILDFYSTSKLYYIITEYCPNGELFNEIIKKGKFDEGKTAFIMNQIFKAISYCHSQKIIHRDLKPENILIVDRDKNNYPRIKICDFGTSKMFEKGAVQRKLVGSSYYIAPEVLKKNYDEKCDIWSCGVILYILLSGRPPFGGDNDKEIMARVAQGKYDLVSAPFNKISKNCIDLIQKLLVMDPKRRINAQEALSHPWFKDNRSKELFNQIKDESTLKKLIANLKAYRRDSIIQETALAYLVHNFPQMKDVINACKLFNQIDVNGDGKINKNELLKGLKSKIKSDTLEQDVEQIYKNIDMDNNGYIEYEEFVRAAVSKERFINENVLRFAFRYFDKDNSGEITFDEIEAVFKDSVADKSKVHESLKAIVQEVDTNGDGQISFKEFSDIMKKMLKK